MQSRHLSGIACAAALLLASHSAWAQDAPQDAPQNTQSATPAEGESDAAPELPTVTVTSSSMQTTTGMALTVKETPQSVTVMQQEPLRAQGITTMKDALKTTTGVNVIRDGNRVRYQSRGFYIDQIEEDGLAST
ncbi:MAG: TonB-dependent receptor plug domain-containing protein, partial [Ottowia sp.]|nr:TonB-dependent receptor plug domain-containing protein [Ottowia sp.]